MSMEETNDINTNDINTNDINTNITNAIKDNNTDINNQNPTAIPIDDLKDSISSATPHDATPDSNGVNTTG